MVYYMPSLRIHDAFVMYLFFVTLVYDAGDNTGDNRCSIIYIRDKECFFFLSFEWSSRNPFIHRCMLALSTPTSTFPSPVIFLHKSVNNTDKHRCRLKS